MKTTTLNMFFSRATTTLTLLHETFTDLLKLTQWTGTRHPLLQWLYLTLLTLLRASHGSYSPTTSMWPTKLQLRYDTYWPTLKTGTSPTRDMEQFTRSIAPTARLPSLVRLAEALTRDWLYTNKPREMVMPTITLLYTINWQTTTLTGTAQCLTYSTNYFQQLTLESLYTNLEQTPLNRCQQLPTPYKRFIHDENKIDRLTIQTSNRSIRLKKLIKTDQRLVTNLIQVFQSIPSWLNWPIAFNGPDI